MKKTGVYGYIIGRPINGISLNGFEYVLDEDGDEMIFESTTAAKEFLSDIGVTDEDAEAQGIRFIKVMLSWFIANEEDDEDDNK